jgi:hypothetical protein
MKIHTTNYTNTFIQIAEDCPATAGEMPPVKGDVMSVANMQFDMVYDKPYTYTSDEVFFQVYADRNNIPASEYVNAKSEYFSKGQACFRASPLTKRYGWGVHSDAEGKVALYACETEEYRKFSNDPALKVVKAMKSKR